MVALTVALICLSIPAWLSYPQQAQQVTSKESLFWVRSYDPAGRTFLVEPIHAPTLRVRADHSVPSLVLKIGAVAECKPMVEVQQATQPDGIKLRINKAYLECKGERYYLETFLFQPRGDK